MRDLILDIRDIDRTHFGAVGGKAANLGELTRIDAVHVPAGYCVTTGAFRRFLEGVPSIPERLDRLADLDHADQGALREAAADLRGLVEATPVPDDLAAAITGPLHGSAPGTSWAVRSSATTEDLPTASFAGQHDTVLDVVGPAAVLASVRRCWASLFTERAIAYRRQHDIDDRAVHMGVVVQEMVVADASGVLFTADPTTSNRRVCAVESVAGSGEALVAGQVTPDVHRVRDGEVVDRPGAPVLSDGQVLRLVELGRRIEAHFGSPQDIEWCRADGEFRIVQSRPITTLFPVPEGAQGERVYVSVGHQQMMTDPMTTLGLAFWQLTTPRPMAVAGGRLFVDVTEGLASPAGRERLLEAFGASDPLLADALQTLVDRDIVRLRADAAPDGPPVAAERTMLDADPSLVAELIGRSEAEVADLERDLEGRSGPDLVDAVVSGLEEHRRRLFDPRSLQVITTAMDAARWLDERMRSWLGERNAADVLSRSAPGNVTAEMGLALLDVADAIRPHPEAVALLRRAGDDVLDALPAVEGGRQARDAIRSFLDSYGMRCVGEIDIARTRWSERPSLLVPRILGHVDAFAPGEAARRVDRGLQEARDEAEDLLIRLRALPDGERRAEETGRMIDRVRAFTGYREYPKYGMVSRYSVSRRALLREAARLVDDGVLTRVEDAFHLTIAEFREAVSTGRVDDRTIRRRAAELVAHRGLTPPRVLTSEGEALLGSYRRDDVPAGALVGLPVSPGVVEGRARVVRDVADADLGPDDVLVTTYTDPSWSPLFVTVRGLVTEVGGLMTHGAVVAREYGLPAVVGVEHATRLVRDGQRIRLDATNGWVELLPDPTVPDPGTLASAGPRFRAGADPSA